jgi:hypothetical protein
MPSDFQRLTARAYDDYREVRNRIAQRMADQMCLTGAGSIVEFAPDDVYVFSSGRRMQVRLLGGGVRDDDYFVPAYKVVAEEIAPASYIPAKAVERSLDELIDYTRSLFPHHRRKGVK